MPRAEPAAVALDLGSTRFKATVVDEDGEPGPIKSVATPPLVGSGPIREGDPRAWSDAARGLLRATLDGLPSGLPLGIATQRSTFLLLDADRGRPITPLISWQDQRAASWCDAHRDVEPTVFARTGLVLSGHYIGPKLAAMRESDPRMAEVIDAPSTRLMTLDAYLAWTLGGGRRHALDVTMAARTSLFDIDKRCWSPTLLETFGVPEAVLPEVVQTDGQETALRGGVRLAATIADQAAGAIATLPTGDGLLVSLGTGAFVMRPCDDPGRRLSGYLTAPVLAESTGRWRYAVEAAISGAGTAIDRFGAGPTDLPVDDTDPEAFCIPDGAGLGAPHWRADIGFRFSPAARALPVPDQRRIALEGLLFRIHETAAGLCPDGIPEPIVVTGGLAREPFVVGGLAALLERPVEVLQVPEAVLLAAGRLAAGRLGTDRRGNERPGNERPGNERRAAGRPDTDGANVATGMETTRVAPGAAGRYLRAKQPRWRAWLREQLAG